MVEQTSVSMSRADPERTALKEWAVLVDAMARGEIWAMVRKGGIREQRAGFAVRHDRFLLYPTYFHEKTAEVAPRLRARLDTVHQDAPPTGTVRLSLLAEAIAIWGVRELDALRAIEGAHGLDWSAVESRFRYRDRPGVQVVAVRVRRLPRVVEIPEARRYGGCVSWVALDHAVDVAGAVPTVDPLVLASRLDALGAALGPPQTPGDAG